MEPVLLYPILNDSDDAGVTAGEYVFSYCDEGTQWPLKPHGAKTVRLSDDRDRWHSGADGLRVEQTVKIAYPQLLHGPDGIACAGAELSVCLIWTSAAMTVTDIVQPEPDGKQPDGQGRTYHFVHEFAPGTLEGDLNLSTVVYVKRAAAHVLPREEHLMNDTGVILGEISGTSLELKSQYMEFPMEECRSDDEPLWWLYISEWEDPRREDLFTKDSFCLYLNRKNPACPSQSASKKKNHTKNFDVMVDILAQTYLLLIQKVRGMGCWQDTVDNRNLAENSICSVLHQFIESCPHGLLCDVADEVLLKSLQLNLKDMMQEEP